MNSQFVKAPSKEVLLAALAVILSCLLCESTQGGSGFRVFGRVIDGTTQQGVTNVEVQLYYDPLASNPNDDVILVSTNTDAGGYFDFDDLPGELEGTARTLELPDGFVFPLRETVRLSTLTPTNQVTFHASAAAVLTGSVVIVGGTAALTNFTLEVNATEVEVATDGEFAIPELPASQQTARLIYQAGYYFDERVIQLPAMMPGQTNSMQILWHEPMQTVSKEGTLVDAQGNLLPNARIRFLGKNTGVFVGTKTDANGFYRIYDLPPDIYTVRAFVGRWGVQQVSLSQADSTFDNTAAPPVITVLGDNPATVECRTAYTDAGATATSSSGADLTGSIIVSNTVNTAAVGQYTVTYSVSDEAGRQASATRVVNVVDTRPPQISCPAPVTVGVNAGACFASGVSMGSPTASDTCGEVSLTNNAPATFPLGNTPVIWTATDPAGNSSTCTQLVTVVDSEPPSISCPANVIVSAPQGLHFASGVALGEPIVADNCSVASVTNNASTTFPVGSTVVTWSVTDGSGNSSFCQQTVTVQGTVGRCPGAGTNTTVVAEYWLRERSGNIALNSGTDGAVGNATLTNGAVFSADAPPGRESCGGSIRFPDTGSGPSTPAAQTVSTYDSLAGAERFTVMAWVKREATNPNRNTFARILSDEHPRGLGQSSGFAFRFAGNEGQLALRVNNSEAITSVTGGLVPANDGQWRHVAAVFDGTRPATNTLSRHVHFYVNGVQRGDGNTLTNEVVEQNDYPLRIGNSSTEPSVSTLMIGKISEVRILRNFAPDAVGNNKTNLVIVCHMNNTRDFEPPTITCPSNLTVSTTSGLRYATGVSLGTPVTADNCSVASVSNDATAGFLIGTNIVTWTATDTAGLTATCQQTVTVTWAGTDCPGDSSASSVVSEYRFSEGSGGATVNAGINGPAGNGMLTNGATFSTDVPSSSASGWSIRLPNTGTGSTTPAIETAASYDPLGGVGRFTIMAWVKRESANAASNQSARVVSDTSSTTLTGTTAGVEFRFVGATGSLALRVNGNEVGTSVGAIAPNSNSWHHVAVVYDGTRPATNTLTRNAHFYVDGIQRGDGNALQNEIVASNTNRLTVGNSSVGRGAANLLAGKLDNVLILRDFAPDAAGNGKTNSAIKCYMDRDGF